MKYIIIAVISVLLMTNPTIAKEHEQNIVNKSFAAVVKTQKKLNKQITGVLREVKTEKSSKTIAWGVLLAFLYGIIHALGPGHSKGIIASYFISTEEKLRKVPIMAFQISMTHVITPILIVWITDISLRQVITDPDSQIYWFKLISYSLIVVIGLYMLVRKFLKTKSHCHNSTTLAISAGLVPCIGSLLILLFTKASDMFLIGILLVIAIGLGIGVTVSAAGFLSYYLRKVSKNIEKSIFITIIEFAGPIFIILLGLIMLQSVFIPLDT